MVAAVVPDLGERGRVLVLPEEGIERARPAAPPTVVPAVQFMPARDPMSVRSEAEIEDISAVHDGPIGPGIIVRRAERPIGETTDEVHSHLLPFPDGTVNILAQADPEGRRGKTAWLEAPVLDKTVHAF